jgi:hypothetical protein
MIGSIPDELIISVINTIHIPEINLEYPADDAIR